VLDKDVATVRFILSDGTTVEPPIIPGPKGLDANVFILFVPNGTDGHVALLDAEGDVLSRSPLCLNDATDGPPVPNSTVGCVQ
jgi:hypothetical protein